jgi:hypothetical protein
MICTSVLERHWNKERVDVAKERFHLLVNSVEVETVRNSGAVRTEFVLCAGNTRDPPRKRVDLPVHTIQDEACWQIVSMHNIDTNYAHDAFTPS